MISAHSWGNLMIDHILKKVTEITDPGLIAEFKNKFLVHCLRNVEHVAWPTINVMLAGFDQKTTLLTPDILDEKAENYIKVAFKGHELEEEKTEELLKAVDNSVAVYEAVFKECETSIDIQKLDENIRYAIDDEIIFKNEKPRFMDFLNRNFKDLQPQQKQIDQSLSFGLTGPKYDKFITEVKNYLSKGDGSEEFYKAMRLPNTKFLELEIYSLLRDHATPPMTPYKIEKMGREFGEDMADLLDMPEDTAKAEHYQKNLVDTLTKKYTQLGGPSQEEINKHGLTGDNFDALIKQMRIIMHEVPDILNESLAFHILSDITPPMTIKKIEKISQDYIKNLPGYIKAGTGTYDRLVQYVSQNADSIRKTFYDHLIEEYTKLNVPSQEQIAKASHMERA